MEQVRYELNQSIAAKYMQEPGFILFKHQDLLCCIQRNMMFGTLNGYVAIEAGHPFHGKRHDDKVVVPDVSKIKFNGDWMGLLITSLSAETELNMIRLGMYLQAHGGVSWSKAYCPNIERDVFKGLWWFDFDTNHAGDLQPLELKLEGLRFDFGKAGYTYRDFEYVLKETQSLADQLALMLPQSDALKEAAYNYYCKNK